MFLSVFSLVTSGPWPIMYYLPNTYWPLADFVAIHGFIIHPHQTSLPARAPYWNAQKRTGKPHISQNFFRSWNLFHNENRVTSCFTTTSELARLCSDQMFISDHFHSGFVKHLAADSSQFLGQTSKVNCESFSIIVSACALFGCALNTEAKTMFFLNQ